jgi:hypothetical protein
MIAIYTETYCMRFLKIILNVLTTYMWMTGGFCEHYKVIPT